MVRHSHQDALPDAEFEELVDAAARLADPYRSECRLILYAGGRLGLRAGEIAHLDESWINWERQMIEIPHHDPCTDGEDGAPCGYCHKRARSQLEHHDDLTMDEALRHRWEPKTAKSARAIPYDFDPEVQDAIESYFMFHDGYSPSRVSVNRRVDRVAQTAGMDTETVYPHALRATAATWHAYRGVPPVALQNLFGWANLTTAQKYIRMSGSATAEALRDSHGD